MSDAGVKAPEAEQIGQQTETPAAAPVAPAPTLREEVSKAFEKAKINDGETPAAKAARERDEAGKFAKPGEGKPRETLTLPAKTGVAPVEAKTAAIPPQSWTPAAKAKFAAMDPELQQEVLRRETEMTKQFSVNDVDRTLGKKIRETAGPYLATIKAEGGTEEAAFAAFLNYAHIMRSGTPQQKMQALHTVAQQYNVPLGNQPQQAPPNQMFESLQQRLARLESERQAEVQQRQVQEQFAISSEIESFAAEPGHEHFETVKAKMGALLSNGEAKDMQDAYDQAIWANPEIRSTLTAAQLADADKKRIAENQAQTGAAKWASGSVTGSPGGLGKPNGAVIERSLGDELRANFRAAQGRV